MLDNIAFQYGTRKTDNNQFTMFLYVFFVNSFYFDAQRQRASKRSLLPDNKN